MLLQKFDRRPDELVGFDPNLIHLTRTRLLDQGVEVGAALGQRRKSLLAQAGRDAGHAGGVERVQ